MDRFAALLRRSIADPRSDGQLLAAFLTERDEPAFAELVRRHGPLVWGVCRRTLPDCADAEDAFQATFLVLVRRAARLTANPTVGPWLFKVAAWTARNARRKNARRLARFTELPDAIPNPQPDFTQSLDLDDALLGLPERCRTAVLLCHLEGLTHREAAKRLGCAEGTVSSLVSRGLAKLRTKFAGRDPSTVLTLLGATVPAALADAAVRSATAVQLAASPVVLALTHGVLRMFWIKKATATALVAGLLLAAGIGMGVSVRETPSAIAQDKAAPQKADPKPVKVSEDDLRSMRELLEKYKANAALTQIDIQVREKELAALRKAKQTADEAVRSQEAALARVEAMAKKDVAARGPDEPYVVLTVRGGNFAVLPFTVTEFDATGKVVWSVMPGINLTEQPPAGLALDMKKMENQQLVIDGLAQYLKRLRATPNTPRDFRVVFENDVPIGGFPQIALKSCLDAGFDTIRFTGYMPFGGFIPLLKPGADGEAEGYKRYKGEVVRTKKLLDDYNLAMRTF